MTQVSLYLLFLLEFIYNYTVPVTPMLEKKVRTNTDFPKTTGPDCILVVVLKKWDPELSFALAELFNMSLKESYF